MRASFTSWAERYGTAVAGVAVLLGCALAAPTFTEGRNLLNVGKDAVYLAILSLGFTLALLVAELDLSVADVASLSAVCTGFLVQQGLPPLACAGAGLLAGVFAGMLNGAAVTVLRVPSLIATLGTAAIARGLSFGLTGGVAFVGRWPRGFTGLSRGSVAGVPALLLWAAGVGLLAWWMVKRTRTGARMTATGEAEEAARLAGVPTAGMKRLSLGLAGGCAGLAGVLLVASLSSAAPNMAGDLFLYAVATVLLGMTMFEPGRPNVPGTLFSVLVLKALGNALVLGDGTAGLDAAARGFIAAHLDAAAGLPDADAALAGTLDALDRAVATSGRTLADEMAWRSECAHGWWGMVRPPPSALFRRPGIPALDPNQPFWTACCAPHCKGTAWGGSE